jgi:hypothetical protein
MPIKVGKIKRRSGGVAPQIRVQAPDVGAPVEAGIRRGVAEVGRGIQDLAQGAGDLARGIGDFRGRVQDKKDNVSALEAENNVTVDLTRRIAELKAENTGSKAANLGETLDTEIEAIVSRSTQGMTPGAQERAREAIEAVKLRARVDIANYTVDQLNIAEVQARQNKLNNAATQIQNEPTASNYLIGRASLMAELEASKLSPEAKEGLRSTISDTLANAYFMGKQPSEAVAEFEAMKDGKLDPTLNLIYDAMSGEGQKKLEKELKLREKTFKIEKDRADKENDEDLLLRDMQRGYTTPAEETLYRTPQGLSAARKLAANKAKEVKAETKQRQYRDGLNDPNLDRKTNAEIIDSVDDVEDAEKLIKYRDKILKNPSINGRVFNEVLKSFKADFNEGKFGDGVEGEVEYMRQIRDFQEWSLVNQDKDPSVYYEEIMKDVNVGFFSGMFTNIEETTRRTRREELALDTQATKLLRENNKPVTPANIDVVKTFLRENPQ